MPDRIATFQLGPYAVETELDAIHRTYATYVRLGSERGLWGKAIAIQRPTQPQAHASRSLLRAYEQHKQAVAALLAVEPPSANDTLRFSDLLRVLKRQHR